VWILNNERKSWENGRRTQSDEKEPWICDYGTFFYENVSCKQVFDSSWRYELWLKTKENEDTWKN